MKRRHPSLRLRKTLRVIVIRRTKITARQATGEGGEVAWEWAEKVVMITTTAVDATKEALQPVHPIGDVRGAASNSKLQTTKDSLAVTITRARGQQNQEVAALTISDKEKTSEKVGMRRATAQIKTMTSKSIQIRKLPLEITKTKSRQAEREATAHITCPGQTTRSNQADQEATVHITCPGQTTRRETDVGTILDMKGGVLCLQPTLRQWHGYTKADQLLSHLLLRVLLHLRQHVDPNAGFILYHLHCHHWHLRQ